MRQHPAIQELYLLADKKEVDEWVSKWLKVNEKSQDVIDSKYFSTENHDLLCEHLAKEILKEDIEEIVEYDVTNKKYSVKLISLRNK